MSLIIEVAVIGSVASMVFSVISAFLAKRSLSNKKKDKVVTFERLRQLEDELQNILQDINYQNISQSKELKEHIDKTLKEIKATGNLVKQEQEHNKTIQPTQKVRG